MIQLFKVQKAEQLSWYVKFLEKNKMEGVERTKLVDIECISNNNTVAEEHLTSKNIGGIF